jgi:predicted Zn finger-like uncharacterized protein
MIIVCSGCSRKFSLDEHRLKPAGSRVRCTKCGAIFIAVPPAAGEPGPESENSEDRSFRADPAPAETQSQPEAKKTHRIALSVPVSCIAVDGEGNPLNFYIGLITEVGPTDLSVEVYCSTVPESMLVSFINLDNRDVQIKGEVLRFETSPSRKTKLELSLSGTPQEVADYIAQLVKSYHYSN